MSGYDDQDELIETILSFRPGGDPKGVSPVQTPDTTTGSLADPEEQVAELGQAIETLTAEIERIDDRSDDRAESIHDTIEELLTDVTAVQARIEAAPEGAAMSELNASIDRLSEEVLAVQDQIERRFDSVESQFDDLEATLHQLIERISVNRQASEANAESISSIKPALDVIKQRNAVSGLQDRATQAGTTTANCHSCGDQVDIGLLAAPSCPHCGVDFEDVATESGWWRTSYTLI